MMQEALYNVRREEEKPTKVLFISLRGQSFAVTEADTELTMCPRLISISQRLPASVSRVLKLTGISHHTQLL